MVKMGTSLQWLRLCAPNTRGLGLIPGQRTKNPHAATTACAATKTWCSQIHFFSMVKGAIFMLYIFYHNKKEIAQVSESKLVVSRDWGKWRDGVIANVY